MSHLSHIDLRTSRAVSDEAFRNFASSLIEGRRGSSAFKALLLWKTGKTYGTTESVVSMTVASKGHTFKQTKILKDVEGMGTFYISIVTKTNEFANT